VHWSGNNSHTNGEYNVVVHVVAFFVVFLPSNGASQVIKDGLAEGLACQDARTLEQLSGALWGIAHHQASHVKARQVVMKPTADQRFQLTLRKEMLKGLAGHLVSLRREEMRN
jgi:hypothetical protein